MNKNILEVPWLAISVGVISYLISFLVFGNDGSIITQALNTLGFVAIAVGVVGLFKKKVHK